MKAIVCILLLLSSVLTGCSKWNVEPKGVNTPGPDVFSSGQITIAENGFWDFDAGKTIASAGDVKWNVTESNNLLFIPSSGTKYALTTVLDPSAISFQELTVLTYSTRQFEIGLPARNPNANGSIAYVTNEGRNGVFHVDSYSFTGRSITLTWITYSK
ncbi:hypothetical protein [Spirosoma fluminis]